MVRTLKLGSYAIPIVPSDRVPPGEVHLVSPPSQEELLLFGKNWLAMCPHRRVKIVNVTTSDNTIERTEQ